MSFQTTGLVGDATVLFKQNDVGKDLQVCLPRGTYSATRKHSINLSFMILLYMILSITPVVYDSIHYVDIIASFVFDCSF